MLLARSKACRSGGILEDRNHDFELLAPSPQIVANYGQGQHEGKTTEGCSAELGIDDGGCHLQCSVGTTQMTRGPDRSVDYLDFVMSSGLWNWDHLAEGVTESEAADTDSGARCSQVDCSSRPW